MVSGQVDFRAGQGNQGPGALRALQSLPERGRPASLGLSFPIYDVHERVGLPDA